LPHPIITLTTDYGLNDHLVGTMKGVILGIQPEARIVDVSHQVTPFDILDGALIIGGAYSYFPPRTVHVVVVDPGVGSHRRPILVTADQFVFVAPDNGVLSLVYDREPSATVRHITSEHYFRRPTSNTFHGRDIFAPVAAWVTKNVSAESFGDPVTDFVRFALPRPRVADNVLRGVVLRVDTFGNLMTNLTPKDFPRVIAEGLPFRLRTGKAEITRLVQSYSQGQPGEPLAILGSGGFLEISVNQGNAAQTCGAGRGTEVVLELL
jgi:S-adenosyl-L-methionine hydrolase (adenosine-forming)